MPPLTEVVPSRRGPLGFRGSAVNFFGTAQSGSPGSKSSTGSQPADPASSRTESINSRAAGSPRGLCLIMASTVITGIPTQFAADRGRQYTGFRRAAAYRTSSFPRDLDRVSLRAGQVAAAFRQSNTLLLDTERVASTQSRANIWLCRGLVSTAGRVAELVYVWR